MIGILLAAKVIGILLAAVLVLNANVIGILLAAVLVLDAFTRNYNRIGSILPAIQT